MKLRDGEGRGVVGTDDTTVLSHELGKILAQATRVLFGAVDDDDNGGERSCCYEGVDGCIMLAVGVSREEVGEAGEDVLRLAWYERVESS